MGMKVFLTSDHHFFHTNIIKYCERPFNDAVHMNSEMFTRWNETINPEDIVIYVGDLSAGLGEKKQELFNLVQNLNGKKFLIRGNHDHQPDDWYLQAGFKRVFPYINLGGILVIHYSLQTAIERGFKVQDFGTVEYVIHGHTHRVDIPDHENHFNVAADRHNFTPVSYEVAIPPDLHKNFLEAITML